ncbi:MAG: hypothetical protein H7101_12345 [Deinococcales bacterium]|nr:hypothetical protein [Chitinophagaceae bacterium]
MKSYKISVGVAVLLLLIYIIAQVNKPKPLNWRVTLSKGDKNPYGAYILYNHLKNLFPEASINSYREPLYTTLHDNYYKNSAYIAISPDITTDTLDVAAACKFVESGNYIFISAYNLSKKLRDTLGIKLAKTFTINSEDTVSVNFVNPSLKSVKNYTSSKLILNEYFDSIKRPDSIVVLGVTSKGKPNFIKVNCGNGAFFVHAAPLCFSNYFMLKDGNSAYTSKALSYIPSTVSTIMWDEYYKLGRSGAKTPLRFFLNNSYLRWALWLSIIGLLLYVLFNIKRKQRIIPIIIPLHNATLDFIKTIAGVYFGQKDNSAIARKKLQYWQAFVRQHFYLQTNLLNDDFVQQLVKKSGVGIGYIESIVHYISIVDNSIITDKLLMDISTTVDEFYNQAHKP